MGSALAKRANCFRESATVYMARLAAALSREGKHIIDLSLGEPFFGTPEPICNAAAVAMREGYTHYPPVQGDVELRERLSEKLARENSLRYSPEEILITCGAKQAIAHIVYVLCDEGDRVGIISPYWVSYFDIAEGFGVVPQVLRTELEMGYKARPDQIEELLEQGVRVVVLNSPSNPAGVVYTREELAAFAEVLIQYPEVWVVSDEVYEKILFDGCEYASIGWWEELRERVVIVNSFSKTYAMTGWRVGYMAGPRHLIEVCTRVQGQTTSGANSIAQRAALAALQLDMGVVEKMVSVYRDNLRVAEEYLRGLGDRVSWCSPQGAFYLFVRINFTRDTLKLVEELLRAGVSVVYGGAFGHPDCVRISLSVRPEHMARGMEIFCGVIERMYAKA